MSKKIPNKKLIEHSEISLGVTVVDGLNLAAIYTMFLHPVLNSFLEALGKYILFPIAAVAAFVQAGLAWREAKLEKWKKRTVAHAVVETVAALAITTGVIGALAFTAIFATVTPLIFVAVGAAKTIYHGGMALYNDIKSVSARTPELKAKYRERAIHNGIAAGANLVAASVAASVFLLGKFAGAAVGVACGLFIVGMGIYKGVKAHQAKQKSPLSEDAFLPGEKQEPSLNVTPEPQNSNTLGIGYALTPEGGNVAETFKRQSDDTHLSDIEESVKVTNQNPTSLDYQEKPIIPDNELRHRAVGINH